MIGTIIRQKRREKDLTQEQLAEYLGITARAVSQWETGHTSPDISQIPLLCNLFSVTADELLGIDINSKQQKIDEINNAAFEIACTGDHRKSVEMWLDGISRYPDSFEMIEYYINEIYMYSHMLDDRQSHIDRALGYIERVLSDCTDNKIRNEVLTTACMWYPKLGKTDRALELADTMPEMTRSDMLLRIYSGNKKFEQWRGNIMGDFTHSIGFLSDYAYSKDNNGNDIYTDDEKLKLCETQIAMFRLFFENSDFMFHSQYVEQPYSCMAKIYASRKDAENTLNSMENAAEFAMHFDTYDHHAMQTSLIPRYNISGGVWWHDTHNRSYDLLEWFTADEIFEFVRKSEEYGRIIDKLKTTAK